MVLHSIALGTAVGATVVVLISVILYVIYSAIDGSRENESAEDVSRRGGILGWICFVTLAILGVLWWLVSLQQHEPVNSLVAIVSGIIIPPIVVYGIILIWGFFDHKSSQGAQTE